MSTWNRATKTAMLSILSNTTLIILKVVAGLLSGSISIISEAIHSAMDLMASIIAFFSVRISSQPADKEHPFGHGKIEYISGIAEGILIFIAAGLIIKEAFAAIITPPEVSPSAFAIGVMLVAATVNFFVSRKLYQVAHEEDSMALEADALHLKTDVLTSLGVAVGLLAIRLTGLHILDPLIALFVALLIIKEAWALCANALAMLLDTRLDPVEEERIHAIIEKYSDQIDDYHKLKTRKSGKVKVIDFHITVDPQLTVQEMHDLIACFKRDMNVALSNTRVSVHVDPRRDAPPSTPHKHQ